MMKIVTLALALYVLVALFTRGARKDDRRRSRLKEEADRAVILLATTTRFVLIAIGLFVLAALAIMLYDWWKG